MAPGPILVVGGTGLLGRAVVDAAVRRGRTVVATAHRHDPPADTDRATWRRVDATGDDALARLVAAVEPEVIVNCAYVQQGPELWPLTAEAPAVLADLAAGAGACLVQVSTDLVFDGRAGRPYVEDDPVSPLSDYGRAKVVAEQAVLARHPGALVARTSLLWGGTGDGAQEALVRRAVEAGDITFFTNELRSPVAVDDLAPALLDLVDAGATGVVHVGGADGADRLVVARALAVRLGLDPSRLRGGLPPPDAPPRATDCRLDSGRAAGLRGRSLPGILRGLDPADVGPAPASRHTGATTTENPFSLEP